MLTASAILRDGKIYTGKRHHNIIHDMVDKYGFPPPICDEQGFITDKGEFLNREDAKKHAFECGQITKTIASVLTSEDLW